MSARTFDLGDVLSITTGLLVSPRRFDALYDVLNFMTGDDLFTHQIPRAVDECKPEILRQHPDLAEVPVPAEFESPDHVWRWLAEQVEQFGATRDLRPLQPADHTYIDPLAELSMMAPGRPVITVEVPEDKP